MNTHLLPQSLMVITIALTGYPGMTVGMLANHSRKGGRDARPRPALARESAEPATGGHAGLTDFLMRKKAKEQQMRLAVAQ